MCTLSIASLLAIVLTATAAVRSEEFLPTPFTAEQIGEAWREGYEMTLRVWTPQNEVWSKTRVETWSRDSIETSEQEIDDAGSPRGEKSLSSSSWESLRDHARFLSSTTTRDRAEMDTPLGRLAGWLYTAEGTDGSISEFFFADDYPGPPVLFSRTQNEQMLFSAEMTEVVPAP